MLFFSCHSSEKKDGTISMSGAFALYPMAVKWAEEYKKTHPNVRIDISAGGAGKGMTDALAGVVDIGLVSRQIHKEEEDKGAWAIAVVKDAVIPTVSAKHPQLNAILTHGLSKASLENIFIKGGVKMWSEVGISSDLPMHAYTRSDAAGAAESWANYFGKKQEDLKGIGVFGDPGLAQAVQKDPAGIGYNNIAYIYDHQSRRQTNGVNALPVDLNGNGTIDADENFYTTIDDLMKAISDGKYPAPPARDLYFVTKGKLQNKQVTEFIQWVLTEGQQYVHDAGYINLPQEKIDSGLEKLK